MQRYFPNALERLTEEFARLPGIGGKTAQRLAFHLLSLSDEEAQGFADAIVAAKRTVHTCPICQNLTDAEQCPICADEARDHSVICVVAEPRDVIAMERAREFNGVYHVLGGVISPMEGIGPKDIEIDSLIERISKGDISELILALPTTMEGDTTNFYIYRRIENQKSQIKNQKCDLRITQIARGVAVGNQIEYTDEITLGRSIVNRIEFKG